MNIPIYNIMLAVFMCTLFPSLARSSSAPPLSGIVSAVGWRRQSTSFKASGSAHLMSSSNNNNHHLPSLFISSRATAKHDTTTRNVKQNQCCNNAMLHRQDSSVSSRTSTPTKLTRLNISSLQMTSSSPADNTYTPPNENYNNKEECINISIEYCSACRWMLRSNWIASEVLTTFANESKLHSVTLVPAVHPYLRGVFFVYVLQNIMKTEILLVIVMMMVITRIV